MTLAERLREWTNWDIAEYHLGVVLGLFPEWPGSWTDDATEPIKGLIWKDSPVGDALSTCLSSLYAKGVLLHDDEGRYRWPTERERNWEQYRRELVIDPRITGLQSRAFVEVWQRLRAAEPNMMYPSVTILDAADGGALALSWTRDSQVLDIEIGVHGDAEWFFVDPAVMCIDNDEDHPEHGYAKYAQRFRYEGEGPP